ncbi:hypothetical protein BJ165DRAFT_1448356 [Panaeolus papilionaceus]|nr:hypothetical protein BJ165DRAFT_1448356 [Panaeolus papilionaceus]
MTNIVLCRKSANKDESSINLNVDYERKQCDAKIHALKCEIRQLGRRRNQLAPDTKLPSAILYKIFLHLRNCDKNQSKSIIYITWVCQRWRCVAINDPSLWSHLDFGLPTRWIQMSKERSAGLPLSIVVPANIEEEAKEYLKTTLEESHRIRSLEIIKTAVQFRAAYLSPLCSASAPLLQSLMFKCTKGRNNSAATLPYGFLSEGTPNLQSLELSGWCLPWTSSLFNGLSSLSVNADGENIAYMLGDLNDFLDALDRMPGLRSLHLGVAFAADDPPSSAVGRVIPLPFLQILTVVSRINDAQSLLEHVSLPVSARLHLELDLPRESDEEEALDLYTLISEFASALDWAWIKKPLSSPATTHHFLRTIRVLQIAGYFTFEGWHECIDFAAHPAAVPDEKVRDYVPRAPLYVSLQDLDDASEIAHLGFSLFPFRNLVSICLDMDPTDEAWTVLGELPSLESISLHPRTALSFVEYLDSDPAIDTALNNNKETQEIPTPQVLPTYFRNVKRLSFEGVNFALGQICKSEDCESLHWKRLIEILYIRHLLDAPIRRLRLSSCINLQEHDLEDAKELVDGVEWDKVVKLEGDSNASRDL